MKREPTDTDREAATLFTPAPGMSVFWMSPESGRWVRDRVSDADANPRFGLPRRFEHGPRGFDTDDPATVGVMLAQVDDARPSDDSWLEPDTDAGGIANGRWLLKRMDGFGGVDILADESSKGAALVAAMRALKGKP